MRPLHAYLVVLTILTIAVAPFPTGQLLIDAPLPTPIPQRQTILGYERTEFGPGWGHPTGLANPPAAAAAGAAAHAGCDTRDVVLALAFNQDCHIPWSRWHAAPVSDPYTGQSLTPGEVEIDHILPVSAAWDLGAHAWTPAQRVAFYNDTRNLVAVASDVNQAKGDKLPSEWMPPNPRAGCAYGRRLILVAKHYALPLPEADLRSARRACAGVRGLAARREL